MDKIDFLDKIKEGIKSGIQESLVYSWGIHQESPGPLMITICCSNEQLAYNVFGAQIAKLNTRHDFVGFVMQCDPFKDIKQPFSMVCIYSRPNRSVSMVLLPTIGNTILRDIYSGPAYESLMARISSVLCTAFDSEYKTRFGALASLN